MKQTETDREFARRFAEALQPHIVMERNKGRSLAEIAKTLGVTAAGLQKQLAGGTPSVRTVALAHAHYKISVRYEGIEVATALTSTRKKKPKTRSERQLLLPLDIIAPVSSTALVLKRLPQGIRRYRLQLTVGL